MRRNLPSWRDLQPDLRPRYGFDLWLRDWFRSRRQLRRGLDGSQKQMSTLRG